MKFRTSFSFMLKEIAPELPILINSSAASTGVLFICRAMASRRWPTYSRLGESAIWKAVGAAALLQILFHFSQQALANLRIFDAFQRIVKAGRQAKCAFIHCA